MRQTNKYSDWRCKLIFRGLMSYEYTGFLVGEHIADEVHYEKAKHAYLLYWNMKKFKIDWRKKYNIDWDKVMLAKPVSSSFGYVFALFTGVGSVILYALYLEYNSWTTLPAILIEAG
jgi:hypothetical protein